MFLKNTLAILGLIAIFTSCSIHSTKTGKRFPANQAGTSCQQLVSVLLHDQTLTELSNQSLYKNSIEKLSALNLTSDKEIKILLKDPYYKELVFQNENVGDLKTSALIIDLLRKSHPESSSEEIVKKYHKLFHTCGI